MREPEEELQDLEEQGLRRVLRRLDSSQGPVVSLGGAGGCVNFSSNDYLGFASLPELIEIHAENVRRFGAGAGASRLVCGTMGAHLDLEEQLAAFKRSEGALTFSSGFAAATGALPALCGKDDVIILDKLCHASLIDGSRLSGATLRVFPHNDLSKLESHLLWARKQVGEKGRILVVTESVFSMDGDLAPLADLVELKDRHGALLLLDEAHAFGVLGPEGRGLAARESLESQVDFQMGTFSKAAGLSGGYLCTSRAWADLLINRARSFIYSTAPAPALAASIGSAVELLSGELGNSRRTLLREHVHHLAPDAESAILPIVIGGNSDALDASDRLLEEGYLVPAIRYPTVPRGTARLRVTVSAAHSHEHVESLKNALADLTASR